MQYFSYEISNQKLREVDGKGKKNLLENPTCEKEKNPTPNAES